jgi:uncharacterized membrane protein
VEFGRGLSFFDAIYGFAITLLIANLDPPPESAWTSLDALLSGGFGSQLLGFVISFVVIVVFWRNNVDLMRRLSSMDSATVTANVVTVGLIVFIPFTTQGISDPATSDLPLPTALYAVNISAAILTQIIMFELARRRGLVAEPESPTAVRMGIATALLTPVVFLASIPVAYLISADVAKYCWLSLVVIGPLAGRVANDRIRKARVTAGPGPAAHHE